MKEVLSIFAGLGGLDLAFEALGYEIVAQVEYDEFCNRVLAKHWPEVKRYGDIRTAKFDEFERVDGIIGGFPCQPFSVAGSNKGEDDERNMWPEVIRAIRALRPGFAFLENVPGLLAHEYFGRILGDLAEAGYDAEWGTFRASDVGAPHRRERLFILAYASKGRFGKYSLGTGNVADAVDSGRGRRESFSTSASRSAPNSEAERPGDSLADARHAGRPGRVSDEESGPRESRSQSSSQSSPVADAGRQSIDDQRRGSRPEHQGSCGELADSESERLRPGGIRVGGVTSDAEPDYGSGDVSAEVADTFSTGLEERARQLRDDEQERPATQRGSYAFPPAPNDYDGWTRLLSEMPEVEPAICRDVNVVPDRAHRLKALGNAVVWPQAVLAFTVLSNRIVKD